MRDTPPAHLLLLSLALLAVGIAYLPSFDAPFVFDDLANIVQNRTLHITQWSDLGQVLDSPISARRPLALASFAVQYRFGGLEVFDYHLVNLTIHLLNTALVYGLTLLLGAGLPAERRRKLAFWAALLWAVNPVQIQAVTYIVQRMTSLATLFYLTALIAYVGWRQRRFHAGGAFTVIAVALPLGMASKEIVATFPLAVFALEAGYFRRPAKQLVAVGLAAAAIIAALAPFYLPESALQWLTTYPNREFSPLERQLTEFRVIWIYLSLFFFPWHERLTVDFDLPVSQSLIAPWSTLPALVGVVLLLVLALRLRRRAPYTATAVLFFLATSSLEASFLNLELAFVHRLYLPSILLVFGLLADFVPVERKGVSLVLLVVTALLAHQTIERNREWQSRDTLWAADAERGASPLRSQHNRASALVAKGYYQEALALLEDVGGEGTALARSNAHLLRGISLAFLGRLEEAVVEYDRGLALAPGKDELWYYKGLALIAMGRRDEAAQIAQRLAGEAAIHPFAIILRSVLFEQEGRPAEAVSLLRATLDDPRLRGEGARMLKLRLGNLYRRLGQRQAAYNLFFEVTQENPGAFAAWQALYELNRESGREEAAAKIRAFLEAKGIRMKSTEEPTATPVPGAPADG